MDEHSDLVADFCGITGCSYHVAENYLAAHDWDPNRAIDFYFQHPPGPDDAAAAPRQDQPGPLQRGDDAEPIVLDDEDEELRRALAASMQGASPPAPCCREFQQI